MTQLLLDYYSGNRQPNFAVFEKVGFKAAIRKFSMQLSQDIELDIDIPAQKAAGWGVGAYHWADAIPAPAYWYKQAWIADYYFYGQNIPNPMHIDAAGLADLIPDILADPINKPTGVTNIVM